MLARRLVSRAPALARAAAHARVPAVAATQKRWGSTNFPATSFLDPPREAETDVQRVGQHGPVRNLDVKESTVELSPACECCPMHGRSLRGNCGVPTGRAAVGARRGREGSAAAPARGDGAGRIRVRNACGRD